MSFEFDLMINGESDIQHEKQSPPIISTEAGRQTDRKDEQTASAPRPILVSFDFESKVNDETELQAEKHSSPMNSTEAGIKIDRNDVKDQRDPS
jgi:hypothetical protein